MANFSTLTEWLNIRPTEVRRFVLAFVGALLLLSFVILTRSLREAFFLAAFDVRRLPWMMLAVVLLGLPLVGWFGRILSRRSPLAVIQRLTIVLALGLCPLWAIVSSTSYGVLLLYCWTALGSLLLTSGFWLVIANLFPLRGAKRLFGMIGAGGTAGAMLTGISLAWITDHVDLSWLILAAVGQLLALLFILSLLPKSAPQAAPSSTGGGQSTDPSGRASAGGSPRGGIWAGMRLVWRSDHLRVVATLVFVGTLMTTFIDYLFKDFARAAYHDGADLAAFFGAFYGWAGAAALIIQVFLAGKLLDRVGVGRVLALVPTLAFVGCGALLFTPGLVLITAVRGVDYGLRKALYRPTIELLYVPVPAWLRNRTKTFIDSSVDSVAEGFGALLIVFLVSVLDASSRHLAVAIMICGVFFLLQSRRTGQSYFRQIAARLREADSQSLRTDRTAAVPSRDLLSATFTNLDLRGLLPDSDFETETAAEIAEAAGATTDSPIPAAGSTTPATASATSSPAAAAAKASSTDSDKVLAGLSSSDDQQVLRTIARFESWNPEHVDAMVRLMARDSLFQRVVRLLQRFPDEAAPALVDLLLAEDTDFVIRRRIPDVLAKIGGTPVDDALVETLTHNRFEVRYRAAIALIMRRKLGLPRARRDWRTAIWHAISMEVRRERPLWELQKLLDNTPIQNDDLVTVRVGVRGELSLEHTFRLLSLVLDPEQTRAAYHGIILEDPQLKSFALEYLDHVLPQSIRHRLWVFIGDVSEKRKARQLRSIDAVVADLMATGQTLFGGELSQIALRRIVEDGESGDERGDTR